MSARVVAVLERIVVIAIILVLIQSFFEDLAILLDWSWPTRRALIFAAFGFDLFFSIEFLTRFYFAFTSGRASRYVFKERGWIDFLAGIPLLLLISGPTVFAIAAGGAPLVGAGRVLNLLKVVKAIRIARILRLLRALKIFKHIKHANSVMAQRHVARISTISVGMFVFVVFAFAVVDAVVDMPGLDSEFQSSAVALPEYLREQDYTSEARGEALERFADREQSVLVVREGEETRYSRHSDEFYDENFGPSDYTYLTAGSVGVFIDLRPLNRAQSRDALLYFVLIIVTVLAFLFIYGPHFAVTVSDPIHVMRRGIEEQNYNLQVSVPPDRADDEVFTLARAYNERFLPMKDRTRQEESSDSELSLDDVGDLFDNPETGSDSEE